MAINLRDTQMEEAVHSWGPSSDNRSVSIMTCGDTGAEEVHMGMGRCEIHSFGKLSLR